MVKGDSMEIKEIYNKIKQSDNFKEFKEKHPKAFLNYVFYVEPDATLEFGLYDPNSKQIGVFSEENYRIEDNALSDKHKEELNEGELIFNNLLEKASKTVKEKYNAEFIKKICLLSKHDKAEWRFTFLLKNMKTIFVISDLKGNIKKEEEIKLFSFT